MRQANVTVKVSRYGQDTLTLSFDNEPTLEEVLLEGGITLSASESCSIDGQLAQMSSIIEDGDSVQIVGKKEGGLI